MTNEANADALLVWQVKRVGSGKRIEASLLSRSAKKVWSSSRNIRASESESSAATEMVKELLTKIGR